MKISFVQNAASAYDVERSVRFARPDSVIIVTDSDTKTKVLALQATLSRQDLTVEIIEINEIRAAQRMINETEWTILEILTDRGESLEFAELRYAVADWLQTGGRIFNAGFAKHVDLLVTMKAVRRDSDDRFSVTLLGAAVASEPERERSAREHILSFLERCMFLSHRDSIVSPVDLRRLMNDHEWRVLEQLNVSEQLTRSIVALRMQNQAQDETGRLLLVDPRDLEGPLDVLLKLGLIQANLEFDSLDGSRTRATEYNLTALGVSILEQGRLPSQSRLQQMKDWFKRQNFLSKPNPDND